MDRRTLNSRGRSDVQQPFLDRKARRCLLYIFFTVCFFYNLRSGITITNDSLSTSSNTLIDNINTTEKKTDIISHNAQITTHIPPNFIINTKSGLHNEPLLIQQNVKNNLFLFPNYTFIQDDDASCLEKMKQIPTFANSNHTFAWFQSNDTLGMLKSDACRLAQLYIHGGVYLDNDLELRTSLLDLISDDYDIITSVSLDESLIFQAIVAASPREYFQNDTV